MNTGTGSAVSTLRSFIRTNRRKVGVGSAIVAFAVIGLILISISSAATQNIVLEAESGQRNGNFGPGLTLGASEGASVAFGAGGGNPIPPTPVPSGTPTLPLKVSTNGRYLVGQNNVPFYYLGDTAWSMLVSLTQQEMTTYMTTRKNQGFSVIQAAIYFDQNGQPRGTPFNGSVSSINQAFFQSQVDFAVAKSKELGLVLALHPIWAEKSGGVNGAINSGNAQGYGQFLGSRYNSETGIIWVMGGDLPGGDTAVWRNLAKGIAIGQTGSEDYSKQLMLYHPRGNQTALSWFSGDSWMDIAASQSGHCLQRDPTTYDHVSRDYGATPVRPVLDFEPLYEDHPYCWAQPPDGSATGLDIRKISYWAPFAGAMGNTYGHHVVWPFSTGNHPFNSWGGGSPGTWQTALNDEAASQMIHLRKLMDSRPFTKGVPDQSVLTSGAAGKLDQKRATRADDGSYLMVYSPSGGFSVNLNKLSGTAVKAWWYNPRSGQATPATVTKGASVALTPPDGNDWVFVADDAAQNFQTPGQ
jgi:hypothetical protein